MMALTEKTVATATATILKEYTAPLFKQIADQAAQIEELNERVKKLEGKKK